MTSILQHPEWLSAAAAGVAACIGVLLLSRLRHEHRRATLLGGRRRSMFQLSDALLAAAVACIALALLGPLAGRERVRLPASGLDVVILLDVSRSMEAADTPPSRLARARRAAAETLRELGPDDRAALAVFAGQAAALTPLTPDKAALLDLLRHVDTRLTSDRSSQLAAGLQAALSTFDPQSARPRRLLVLSDGEHGGDVPAALLAELRRAGVRVVSAAIGSEAGASVPAKNGRPLRHANGDTVTSRRDFASLERIATGTGGVALPGDAFGGFAPGSLSRALSAGATPAGEGFVEQEVLVPRARIPAALAALLLIFELLRRGKADSRGVTRATPSRPDKWMGRFRRMGRVLPISRPKGSGAVTATTVLLAALTLGASAGDAELEGVEARLRADPDDTRLLIELGVVRAREGQMREAERAFLAASLLTKDPELAALAYYDLGVALLSRGHYEGARDAFFDALAFDPEHEAARFNLAWTLRALSANPPRPSEAGGKSEEPEESEQGEPGDEPRPADDEPSNQPSDHPEASTEPQQDQRHQAPSLDPEEAQRWLDSVQDDPSRALRGALGDAADKSPGSGPRW